MRLGPSEQPAWPQQAAALAVRLSEGHMPGPVHRLDLLVQTTAALAILPRLHTPRQTAVRRAVVDEPALDALLVLAYMLEQEHTGLEDHPAARSQLQPALEQPLVLLAETFQPGCKTRAGFAPAVHIQPEDSARCKQAWPAGHMLRQQQAGMQLD